MVRLKCRFYHRLCMAAWWLDQPTVARWAYLQFLTTLERERVRRNGGTLWDWVESEEKR